MESETLYYRKVANSRPIGYPQMTWGVHSALGALGKRLNLAKIYLPNLLIEHKKLPIELYGDSFARENPT